MPLIPVHPIEDRNGAIAIARDFLRDELNIYVNQEDVKFTNQGERWVVLFYKAPWHYVVAMDPKNSKVVSHLMT